MIRSFSPRTARALAVAGLGCLLPWRAGRTWSGEPGSSDKFALWTKGTRLRGANVYQTRAIRKIYADSLGPGPYGPPFEQRDFDALSKAGANFVVLSHPGLFREKPPYDLDQDAEKNLDRLIGLAEKADLFVVIAFRTGPGRSEYAILRDGAGAWFDKSYINDDIWKDARAQKAFAEMWKHTALRYRGNTVVVGYNLMVEPNPDHVLDLEADTFYPKYADTTYDWNTLSARLTKAVREVDGDTPILVGGIGYSGVAGLTHLTPSGDKRTVYDFHQYEPLEQYTHQHPGPDGSLKNAYPGKMDADGDEGTQTIDKSWLDDLLLTVEDFRRNRAAPVAATEFGVIRTEPGADKYLDDEMDLFERKGINYAVWEWNTSCLPDRDLISSYNQFNYRFGPDPASEAEKDSTLMAVLRKHWAANQLRPSNFRPLEPKATSTPPPPTRGATPVVEAAGRVERLRNASTWMYQLQGLDDEDALKALAATEYPLLVLEPGHNLKEDPYDTRAMLQSLRTTPSGKRRLLLAYVDIGQAEDYRDYWRPDWQAPTEDRPGKPEFLVTIDPDGWSGNYSVAYWKKPWQDLWLSEQGIVKTLARLGFDGAYLDWVEDYDDERVSDTAARDGVDAPKAMIEFVAGIRAAGRAVVPDFLVVAQNAPYLIDAEPNRYAGAIDALAVEDTWYHGEGDADWDSPRAGDLRQRHDGRWSTENRLKQYRRYLERGLPVFSVDYCVSRSNAEGVYRKARQAGLRPLVTRVSLSRLTPTPPEPEPAGSELVYSPALGASAQNPAYSPDGSRLLFTLFHEGYNKGRASLMMIKPGETKPSVLFERPGHDCVNLPGASWNAKTDRIVFGSDMSGSEEIWSLNPRGAELRQVTRHDTAMSYREPSYSPDGGWIAFEAAGANENAPSQIYKIQADGKGLTPLTAGFDDRQPNWSPAGDRIVFQRRKPKTDDWELYTVKPDGSDIRPVTRQDGSATDASWSPDGGWIVYSNSRGGLDHAGLFVISADGGAPTRLTEDASHEDGAPAWSADGRWITFESHRTGSENSPTVLRRIRAPAPSIR